MADSQTNNSSTEKALMWLLLCNEGFDATRLTKAAVAPLKKKKINLRGIAFDPIFPVCSENAGMKLPTQINGILNKKKTQ